MARREEIEIRKLPRSVISLLWALAAMHWRTMPTHLEGLSALHYSGATYKGLRHLLGIQARFSLLRLVKKAEDAGAVVVIRRKDERNRFQPVVILTRSTLKSLESAWANH